MANENEITTTEGKKVIFRTNDGVKLSPVIHANSIHVNGDIRPLGEILEDNKEALQEARDDINSNNIKIEHLSDLHDDLLYYDDDSEEDKITDLAIIIKPDLITADINNAELILKEIRNTIRKMNEQSVAHTKFEDPNNYVKLNTTQQEIENLRAEITLMQQKIAVLNEKLSPDNFAKSKYGDAIARTVRDVELPPIYSRLEDLERRVTILEQKDLGLEKLIGTREISDLPGYEDGEEISILKVLWALYSTVHNFIDLDNETSETKK